MTNFEKTCFMNKDTFSETEIKSYPYSERRTFYIWFEGQEMPIKIYAVDEASLYAYIEAKYDTSSVSAISEQFVEYQEVKIPENWIK